MTEPFDPKTVLTAPKNADEHYNREAAINDLVTKYQSLMQDALKLYDCIVMIQDAFKQHTIETGNIITGYPVKFAADAITAWNEKYKIPNKETRESIRNTFEGKNLTITTLEELKEELK
jgi:hypothetical protein